MNKLIIFITIIILLSVSFVSHGVSNDNAVNVYYHPVQEVEVDELPEWIVDIEVKGEFSQLPIVFRGAAKNWKAMEWTPESLEARGFYGVNNFMNKMTGNEPGTRLISGQTVHIKPNEREILMADSPDLKIEVQQ